MLTKIHARSDAPSGVSFVKSLIDRHQPGFGLAREFYADQTLFEVELEAIWYRQWLLAGVSCEVMVPGQWIKVDVGRASVVIARGEDGALRGFHNTCRHRGSRICREDKGKSRNFVCPYHQWTYASTGQLLFARDMGPAFDKEAHGLHPVHVREVGGYVFMSLAKTPAPFEEFEQVVQPYLAPHDLAHAKVAHESKLIERGNWKLVLENNRECYHCRVSHPELLKTIAEVEDLEDPKCSPAFRGKSRQDTERWERQDLPHKLYRAHGWQIVRVPMTKGLSFTIDGAPASQRVMGTLPDMDVGSARLASFPSTWNHALGDHAIVFQVLPLDAQTTQVTTKWLVHQDAVEGVDYEVENLVKVWNATNLEDRTLVENNHAGILSPGYQPGPYSHEMEFGVIAFIDWYLVEMKSYLAAAR